MDQPATTAEPSVGRHARTRPRSANFHLFDSAGSHFAFDVGSATIHQLPAALADALGVMLDAGDPQRAELVALALGIGRAAREETRVPESVPVTAISLAVAQKCNLGCSYCYAQGGSFGGAANDMPAGVARAAIDRLIVAAEPGRTVTLAFMGGEPLASRETLHEATRYAAGLAAARGVGVGFSMTTNATLLRDEDIDLFHEFDFTLTVSLDGVNTTHDQLRPFRGGNGSFARVADNVSRLLAVKERRHRVIARVTVTPRNLDLLAAMSGLLEMGFDGIMFSPMLSAPSGNDEMAADDLDRLLLQLVRCGDMFRNELEHGRILPLMNVTSTLRRIRAGEPDQYPCGAGGGYMGVAADGGLYACHRFVNDETGAMGTVFDGVDAGRQARWLEDRHLCNQSPCHECWARHLCSGSCHYEVIKRGRPACDYIRGWLDYCLRLYAELGLNQPAMLQRIVAEVA